MRCLGNGGYGALARVLAAVSGQGEVVSLAQGIAASLAGRALFRPGGAGLGRLGSFIVRAAIWHIVGQAVFTIFRRFPAVGTIAAVLLVCFVVYLLVRWVGRRRQRQRPYNGARQGPRDW